MNIDSQTIASPTGQKIPRSKCNKYDIADLREIPDFHRAGYILRAMHKPFTLIAVLATFGVIGVAQDEAQYQTWMKSIPPTMTAIRNAPDNAAAAADATKLADTFDHVATFWKARNAEDAVKFAETARDAAKAIAAGTGDKAANLRTIQGTLRRLPLGSPRGNGRPILRLNDSCWTAAPGLATPVRQPKHKRLSIECTPSDLQALTRARSGTILGSRTNSDVQFLCEAGLCIKEQS